MRIKNKYGWSTAPTCFFCFNLATTKNKDGLTVCKQCKDREEEISCPICRMELEVRQGKYGQYFYCWSCGKNWNKYSISRFRK